MWPAYGSSAGVVTGNRADGCLGRSWNAVWNAVRSSPCKTSTMTSAMATEAPILSTRLISITPTAAVSSTPSATNAPTPLTLMGPMSSGIGVIRAKARLKSTRPALPERQVADPQATYSQIQDSSADEQVKRREQDLHG
jgi:hypothetical protein